MIWEKDKQNKDIQKHIKTLITLRNKYPEFKYHTLKWLEANDNEEYII